MRKTLLALSVVALALTTAPAYGGNAHPTVTVNPAAPVVGDTLVFAGCGYTPNIGVTVTVQSPSAVSFFGGIAGTDGCFSTAATETYVAQDAGDYTVDAYQGRKRAVASTSFTIS